MNKSQFFYAYDLSLVQYLRKHGEQYITKAIHPNTMKLFFLYQKTDGFQEKLDKFKELKSNL